MPYCPECGAEISEGVKFCPECGAEVSVSEETAKGTSKITPKNFFTRPELVMAISGVILLIASIGPWYPYTYTGGSFVGFPAPGIRAVIAFTGLSMLYSTAVELDYVDFLEGMVPVLNVSAICGSIAFIGSLASLAAPLGGGWGLYLAFVGSLVALFATFRAWKETQHE